MTLQNIIQFPAYTSTRCDVGKGFMFVGTDLSKRREEILPKVSLVPLSALCRSEGKHAEALMQLLNNVLLPCGKKTAQVFNQNGGESVADILEAFEIALNGTGYEYAAMYACDKENAYTADYVLYKTVYLSHDTDVVFPRVRVEYNHQDLSNYKISFGFWRQLDQCNLSALPIVNIERSKNLTDYVGKFTAQVESLITQYKLLMRLKAENVADFYRHLQPLITGIDTVEFFNRCQKRYNEQNKGFGLPESVWLLYSSINYVLHCDELCAVFLPHEKEAKSLEILFSLVKLTHDLQKVR